MIASKQCMLKKSKIKETGEMEIKQLPALKIQGLQRMQKGNVDLS